MIERVLHPHNVQRALKQVIANKGSAGVDRLSVNELTESFRDGKNTSLFFHKRDGIHCSTHTWSKDSKRKW